MSILESIIIAIVEGLTEFLPVSSTGHMVLAEGILGMQSTPYVKAFTVIIQFGAILSVLFYYWRRFLPFTQRPDTATAGADKTPLQGFNLYWLVLLACLPAGVLGLLLEEYIDKLLGSIWVVVAMLFIGGLVMIYLDRRLQRKEPVPITPRRAIIIGIYQCLAMIPGVSRSMATIFGGMQQGLSRREAAEFSFFLAIPTMFGATLLKAYKLYSTEGWAIYQEHWETLLIGNVVAFIVAFVAIRYFIGYISKYGFRVFGYYRIVLAVVMAALILLGFPIQL